MKNLFNSVKMFKPKNNMFDLSHDVKLSLNMGELIPIMLTECVPGDRFNISCESLLRFAPMVAPVMHRMDVTMHYFFVPNRILWPNWENFITNTKDPNTGLLPAFPFLAVNDDLGNYSRLHDYLGIPIPKVLVTENVSALPFAAYQKVYADYYRDQNMQPEEKNSWLCLDGDNAIQNVPMTRLRLRAWEHDYFTSALPFAQKGDAVSIPLGDVTLKDTTGMVEGPLAVSFPAQIPLSGGVDAIGPDGQLTAGGTPMVMDPNGSLEVAPTTVNDLRRAFKLQEWLEKNARGGTRYIENILAHFGVKSSDKRLQRPEYITGTKSPVTVSEVLNTTGTDDLPQGNMAGHAVSVTSGQYGNYSCEEHGYIVGIMSVMPKTAYQQGIPKTFLKFDNTDFYWPDFANLGEQPILNKELYAFQALGHETFGYVPRYSEYKFENNRVAGDFRTTLNHWTMARIFNTIPALNENFIAADPTHRIFAVTDPTQQKLYAHVYNKIKAVRPMPKFGNPTF